MDSSFHTPRLLLRAWAPSDAAKLLPVLQANAARLSPWLPARVAAPAPLDELTLRLVTYADDFVQERAFRFALFSREAADRRLLGGADLHPRTASRRVPLAEADRVEIGYWLTADAEGQGYVLEAMRALLGVAATTGRFTHAEARVDARNVRSANVARRLGFRRDTSEGELDVWRLDFFARHEP